jgi:hypothetical protein
MDLSGNTFGLGANVPFSTAHFDESDAGAGTFQHLRSGVENAAQSQMNASARANPDARDLVRSWAARLSATLDRAESELVGFLKKDAEVEETEGTTIETIPCVERYRQFLRGLDTPGFVTSPSWVARNLRSQVDHDAILVDISGALGMSVPRLQETIQTAMTLYLPSLEAMDAAYVRLQTKLKQIEAFSSHVKALRIPHTTALTPEYEALQSALLHFIESQYAALRIDADYKEFAEQYDRFQAYRSILCLLQPQGGAQPLCTVCMTEPISAAVIPCGHTFCGRCCSTQRNICYICRTPVRDRQRLYFG